MNKKEVRKKVLDYLKNKEKYNEEVQLMRTLFELPEWQSAKSIGITLSMPHEISTEEIIKYALVQGKKVFVPNCHYENKTMDFARYTSPADLHEDEKGILAVKNSDEINNDVELLLVPGLGFNSDGYRVGYGGGYYDRFLSTYDGPTVSLILEEQLMDIPTDDYDQPVHKMITEKRIINGVRQ
ncbi:hypothetical protein GCM10007190_11160 [Macrococcus hajekii]|nr:5-formyltetrahydrofolate cyclo-ligase [Macrococcus hajekii]GGB04805.1 hypothetical protein GCM10007190_11160 [Macrococcus hajekii]